MCNTAIKGRVVSCWAVSVGQTPNLETDEQPCLNHGHVTFWKSCEQLVLLSQLASLTTQRRKRKPILPMSLTEVV